MAKGARPLAALLADVDLDDFASVHHVWHVTEAVQAMELKVSKEISRLREHSQHILESTLKPIEMKVGTLEGHQSVLEWQIAELTAVVRGLSKEFIEQVACGPSRFAQGLRRQPDAKTAPLPTFGTESLQLDSLCEEVCKRLQSDNAKLLRQNKPLETGLAFRLEIEQGIVSSRMDSLWAQQELTKQDLFTELSRMSSRLSLREHGMEEISLQVIGIRADLEELQMHTLKVEHLLHEKDLHRTSGMQQEADHSPERLPGWATPGSSAARSRKEGREAAAVEDLAKQLRREIAADVQALSSKLGLEGNQLSDTMRQRLDALSLLVESAGARLDALEEHHSERRSEASPPARPRPRPMQPCAQGPSSSSTLSPGRLGRAGFPARQLHEPEPEQLRNATGNDSDSDVTTENETG